MDTNYCYSPSENKFYPREYYHRYIDAGSWPSDAVDVSDDVYVEFSGLPPEGQTRASVEGIPAWVDVEPNFDELLQDAERERNVRIATANEVINQNQWPSKLTLGRLNQAEIARFNAWLDYQEQVEDTDISNPTDINWPPEPSA